MSKEAESNLEAADMFRQRGIENRPLTRSAKAMTDGRRESGKGSGHGHNAGVFGLEVATWSDAVKSQSSPASKPYHVERSRSI